MLKLLTTTSLILALTACGTISTLKTDQQQGAIDNKQYKNITVSSFEYESAEGRNAKEAAGLLRNTLVAELKTKNLFEQVSKKEQELDTGLLISGKIILADEGNVAIRQWLGFGGLAHLVAQIQVTDKETGASLGYFDIDKNSYPLGGALSAQQDVSYFTSASASKIVKELSPLAQQ